MSTPVQFPERASNGTVLTAPPGKLTQADVAMHVRLGISPDTLRSACVERLTNDQAREQLTISRSGDMAGILYPRLDPRDGRRTSAARLRRDHPEIENGKPKNKYISAYRARLHLYFPPNAKAALADKLIPVVLVESEKSALAMADLAVREQRGLLPIATGGCDGWHGRIGKAETPDGKGTDETGPSPDFDLIAWAERDVYILFDANVATNRNVWWARARLAHELASRGARVHLPKLPQREGVNGPDDLIAVAGDGALTEILDSAPLFGESAKADAAAFIESLALEITPLTDEQEQALYQRLAVVDARDDRTRLTNEASHALKGTLTKKQISAAVSRRREQLLSDRAEGWHKELVISENGTPKPLLQNAVLMLRHSPEWQGVPVYNEFSFVAEIARPAPWPQSAPGAVWTDDDDSRTACWLQQHGLAVNSKVAAEAVQVVAREHPYHPIKHYLQGLVGDQQPRTPRWLHDYMGAEDTPLNAAIGEKWLIQAAARIFQPGAKADATLLLIGPQGIGKSTALRILAGDAYFTDHLSDLGSKDSRIELLGRWIIELAEFHNRRSELERKGFLTATADYFRAPYDRRTRWVPRSCVFAATSNDPTPLTDETGGRRYWAVTCGEIDIEKLKRDRDQLWAEARTLYQAGVPWHADFPELEAALRAEQESRYQGGPFDEAILPWLENPKPRFFDQHADRLPLTFDSVPGRILLKDVLIHAVGKAQHTITRNDQLTVRACLIHAGWRREDISKIPGTNRTARFYRKVS